MINKYTKPCYLCGEKVPEGTGCVHNEKGEWKTYHNECWDKIKPPEVTPGVEIKIDENGVIHFSLIGFHDRQRFESFRTCIGNLRYNSATKSNLCEDFDRAISIIQALKALDFVLYMKKEDEDKFNAHIGAAFNIAPEVTARMEDPRLRPYQKEGVYWLATKKRGILADDMGLGKTIQILMAIPNNVPVLVVCPASLKHNWKKEAAKWRPDLKPVILSGRGSFRFPKNGEIVIINYDILPDNIEIPNEVGGYDRPDIQNPANIHVIADESQKLKGKETKRWKSFHQWFKKAEVVWMVTATPLLNRPQELWNILDVMGMAEKIYSSWYNFVYVFSGYKDGWGYKWGTPKFEAGELLKRITLRRTKIQVAKDIPAKNVEIVEVEFKLDRLTTMLCDEAMEELENNLDEGNLFFEKLAAARAALAKAKFPALLELVEEYEDANECLVVFSHHKFPLQKLVEQKQGWELLTGETSIDKRNRIVEDFQAGKLKGLAATIQAGGVGITLTYSCNAIFVDKEWTPALNDQAEDRLCRIGQTRPVNIRIMEGGHALDSMVNEVIERKRNIINNSVETINNTNTEFRPTIQVTNEVPVVVKKEKVFQEIKIKDQVFQGEISKMGEIVLERGPKDKMEEDAFYALWQVAMMDPDRAREENGIGFNKFDNGLGHDLVKKGPFHSESGWASVIKLAHKYGGQTGFSRNNYGKTFLTKKEFAKKLEAFTMVFGDEKIAKEKMVEKGFVFDDKE